MSSGGYTRRYDPAGVRQRILSESLTLFARSGFLSTTVDQISSAAGVTKGALYHHFSSKEEILRVLYEDYLAARTARCQDLIASTSDPYRQMALLIDEAFENAVTHKGILGLFLRERDVLARDAFVDARRAQRGLYDIYEKVVRRGQAAGQFRSDLNPRHAAYTILGTLVWSEYWFDASRTNSERFIDDTRLLLLHGLSEGGLSPETGMNP